MIWNDTEAVLALESGMCEVKAIDKQTRSWYGDLPLHIQRDKDRAIEKVKESLRFLLDFEPEDDKVEL